jgi:transposase-like protein
MWESRLRALIAVNPLASVKELSIATQTPIATVRDRVKRLGLHHAVLRRPQKLTPELIEQLYALTAITPAPSIKELAMKLNRRYETIRGWLKRFELPYSPFYRLASNPTISTPGLEARLRVLTAVKPPPTINELAATLNRHQETVRRWVRQYGLPFTVVHRRKTLTPEFEERLHTLTATKPAPSIKKIAAALNMHEDLVRKWVDRLGLPHAVLRSPRKLTPEFKEHLRALTAVKPPPTINQLAIALNRHKNLVRKWVNRLGLPYNVLCRPQNLTPEFKEHLRALTAVKPPPTIKELAIALNRHERTVRKWARQFGLPYNVLCRPQNLTPELKEHLRALTATTPAPSIKELAMKLNRPYRTVKVWIKRFGFPHSPFQRPAILTTGLEERLRVLTAVKPPPTIKELAAALCRRNETIRRWVKQYGLPYTVISKVKQ